MESHPTTQIKDAILTDVSAQELQVLNAIESETIRVTKQSLIKGNKLVDFEVYDRVGAELWNADIATGRSPTGKYPHTGDITVPTVVQSEARITISSDSERTTFQDATKTAVYFSDRQPVHRPSLDGQTVLECSVRNAHRHDWFHRQRWYNNASATLYQHQNAPLRVPHIFWFRHEWYTSTWKWDSAEIHFLVIAIESL